jgi:5-formyltetrahydrofolate cyclo-ligase
MDDKRSVRTRIRADRARRDPVELAAASAALARHGIATVEGHLVVAAYASIRDEPPTQQLLDDIRTRDISVLLPRVVGDDLRWAPYQSWTELTTTERGLLEPRGPAATEALSNAADLVFAPALAVDRRGNRLGRGGGYYDRALASIPRDRIVAVVFDDEVLDELPTDPHDVAVGAALTPSGLVALGDQ